MGIGDLRLSQEVSKSNGLELAGNILVRSVLELLEALKKMSKSDFEQHVSKYNNDFSEWIIENYHSDKFAIKIAKTRNKKKMEKIIEKALKKDLKKFLKERSKKGNKIVTPKKKEVLNFLRYLS